MKKIAISTVYNACNYGSFLQAYALMRTIEMFGYKVEFLTLPVKEEQIIGEDRLDSKYVAYEKMKYAKLRIEQKVFKTTSLVDDSFQCCIIGSDTVWNLFDPAYGEIPYFVGKGIHSKRIISYAASVGQFRLLKIILLKWKELAPIRKFDAISVRDDKTEKVIKLLGRHAKRVLDPTFLYEFKTVKPEAELPVNYLLVYTYGFSWEEITVIKEYAREHSLEIVATGSLCEWADFNLAVSSFEWLWLVENAKVVITSTFHGAVFSIKYNKKFAVLTSKSDKVSSLLKEFELNNCICTPEKLQVALNTKIDYTEICYIKNKKIQESIFFLQEGIGD